MEPHLIKAIAALTITDDLYKQHQILLSEGGTTPWKNDREAFYTGAMCALALRDKIDEEDEEDAEKASRN